MITIHPIAFHHMHTAAIFTNFLQFLALAIPFLCHWGCFYCFCQIQTQEIPGEPEKGITKKPRRPDDLRGENYG